MKKEMKLTPDVEYILDRLCDAGYRADVVGGAVRDHLLGRELYDYDITTVATPYEVKEVFAEHRIVDTGIKHGTVTLVLDNGSYEITTWRVDGDYLDNRHPDSVSFSRTLDEDLARRDFTVNAICYNPIDRYTDIFGGMEDLKAGIIRAVGDPAKRFDEDALRIIRGVRFTAELGFRLDDGTAIAALAKRELLKNVSAERIYTELKKLLASDGAHRTVALYGDIIMTILPELDRIVLPTAEKFATLGAIEKLAALFHLGSANPKESFSSAMYRLKSDTDSRILGENILAIVAEHKPSTLYDSLKILSLYGKRAADSALTLGMALGVYGPEEKLAYETALDLGRAYSVSELEVDGNDLMSAGLSGPEIGKALSAILEAVMHGECENNKDALLNYYREHLA